MINSVSIVTPSYQHQAFIESTLRSVLEQRGDFELDYIVMDGGSTDGTIEILKDFQRQVDSGRWSGHCRRLTFRWLSEPDRGQANAVNKGFGLATGDVLGWLNSDDTYAGPETIAKCVEYFRTRERSHFVYGKGYRIDSSGTIVGEEEYVTKYPVEDLPEIDMILQPAAFWRREVYEAIGPLNESMTFAFDWEYWLRCRKLFEIEFLDEFLACNRFHERTKTNSGGIVRKRELAELLLGLGSFTERSVRAYLAPLPPAAVVAPKPIGRLRASRRYIKRQIKSLWPTVLKVFQIL
jgi:glycosyltransferase involved in cell wall biosynthesis